MGFYDRDYYRESRSSFGGGIFDGWTTAVKFIIFANVVVFLLQIFLVRHEPMSRLEAMRRYYPEMDKKLKKMEEQKGKDAVEEFKKKHPELEPSDEEDDIGMFPGQRVSVIQDWFELDTNKVVRQGQVWRLLTHAFCHDRYSLWHIALNMFCLYWFGITLETMYGTREFVLFYLTAAVVAALAYVGLDLYTGTSHPALGASGAVMAVMMLYTMHYPHRVIYIFWFFPIEMRWVMLMYVIWELHPILLTLSGDQFFTGIGHAAHLGGLAFGFLYARYQWRLEPIADRVMSLRLKFRRGPRLRVVHDTPSGKDAGPDAQEINLLLDKILESGQTSLTEDERTILRNASERIKKRP